MFVTFKADGKYYVVVNKEIDSIQHNHKSYIKFNNNLIFYKNQQIYMFDVYVELEDYR